LVRLDGTFVRRTQLCESDTFMLCLLTHAYYDRVPETKTFQERFWPHHKQRIREEVAATTGDPLDVARAACGLPFYFHGGLF
jgi:hypothetical protein